MFTSRKFILTTREFILASGELMLINRELILATRAFISISRESILTTHQQRIYSHHSRIYSFQSRIYSHQRRTYFHQSRVYFYQSRIYIPPQRPRFDLRWYIILWVLSYGVNKKMCSANVLVEEYILEMVHWYGFFKFSVKMSRDDVHVTKFQGKRGVFHGLNFYIVV